VREIQVVGGVPLLLRGAAACERLRRTCPGEFVASHVLTAGRVNPDWEVSCIGGNYLHLWYLAARDRAI